MEEALSDADEKMDTGVTPAGLTTAKSYNPGTRRELLQDLSENECHRGISSKEPGVAT